MRAGVSKFLLLDVLIRLSVRVLEDAEAFAVFGFVNLRFVAALCSVFIDDQNWLFNLFRSDLTRGYSLKPVRSKHTATLLWGLKGTHRASF